MNPLDRIEQLTKELARVTAERDDWKVRAESGTPARHPLQSIVSNPEPSLPVDVGTIIDGTFGPATLGHIRDAAKMVSPDKHPDTERLDWLWAEGFLPDWESRDAIDAARNQEAARHE